MTRILVTGATGNIGRLTLQHLLKRRPAGDLVGLVRDPAKAADLSAAGIEIRKGDYLDRASLAGAFAGIDTLMLVSATAFTDRDTQHRNAVEAARAAGVRHVVAMPIIRAEGSSFVMPQVTEEDRRVEPEQAAAPVEKAEPTTDAAAEPVAPPPPEEDNRPKRSGWWQRRSFF